MSVQMIGLPKGRSFLVNVIVLWGLTERLAAASGELPAEKYLWVTSFTRMHNTKVQENLSSFEVEQFIITQTQKIYINMTKSL